MHTYVNKQSLVNIETGTITRRGWDYGGLEPNFYFIKFQEKYYAFWNDVDDSDLIDCLTVDINQLEAKARFSANSLDELLTKIEQFFDKRRK